TVREPLLVIAAGPLVVIRQQGGCRARLAREEEQEVVAQPPQRVLRQLERNHIDAVILFERVTADAAVSGYVLVLLTHRLVQDVDLDLACGFGQLPWGDGHAARQRERLE